jgi:hypothetical protein
LSAVGAVDGSVEFASGSRSAAVILDEMPIGVDKMAMIRRLDAI